MFDVSCTQSRVYTGQPDKEWVNEAWASHWQTNDSVITHHFEVNVVELRCCVAAAKLFT